MSERVFKVLAFVLLASISSCLEGGNETKLSDKDLQLDYEVLSEFLYSGHVRRNELPRGLELRSNTRVVKSLDGSPDTFCRELAKAFSERKFHIQFKRGDINCGSNEFDNCLGGSVVGEDRGNSTYIQIPDLSKTSAKQAVLYLKNLKDEGSKKKLILDLRGNCGGYLDSAFTILSSLFGSYTPKVSFSEYKYKHMYSEIVGLENYHTLKMISNLAYEKGMRDRAQAILVKAQEYKGNSVELFRTLESAKSNLDGTSLPWQGKETLVVVDGNCYSGCQLIVSILKQYENVRLVGMAFQPHPMELVQGFVKLPHSKIKVSFPIGKFILKNESAKLPKLDLVMKDWIKLQNPDGLFEEVF